ncbi:hypothetical protein E6C50_08680 [Flavobacterium supellecticarium]|uniref:Uncharacterized protein n=1 Tax=Flavobacterium supellecticarium TaxID=2565924 RepID=A0A4S4A0J8_9FLAO|nr:hypothetical protein [Flavobacterium supellecticarium]THF51821.1 hypothetical protein E6C50_08680 [Flavobacterium supellecticarium]
MVILNILEWLSKYGFIDILFGIGIFTIINKALKSKIKSSIDGADLLPYFDTDNNTFILGIKNQSSQPLYLYQAYVKPGYYIEEYDKTSFETKLRSLMLMKFVNDSFPKMDRPKTTDGNYVLQVQGIDRNISPTLFVEPFSYKEYSLDYRELSHKYIDNPNEIFDNKKFGQLSLNFVHGVNSGKLILQL